MTEDLSQKQCGPCRGTVSTLSLDERQRLLGQIHGWEIRDDRYLYKRLKTKDFMSALALANDIGRIAEREGHHPDLKISWGSVGIEISTHKINDLTENDFILAAKIDALGVPL